MPSRIEKECPRCKGERGHMRDGIFIACITCKTQGKIKVASMAEYRRVTALVTKPSKAQTKQREKER
jgi:hypothetical protein